VCLPVVQAEREPSRLELANARDAELPRCRIALPLARMVAKAAEALVQVDGVTFQQQRRPHHHVDDASTRGAVEVEIAERRVGEIGFAKHRGARLTDGVEPRHQHGVRERVPRDDAAFGDDRERRRQIGQSHARFVDACAAGCRQRDIGRAAKRVDQLLDARGRQQIVDQTRRARVAAQQPRREPGTAVAQSAEKGHVVVAARNHESMRSRSMMSSSRSSNACGADRVCGTA